MVPVETERWVPSVRDLMLIAMGCVLPGFGLWAAHQSTLGSIGTVGLLIVFVVTGVGAAVNFSFGVISATRKNRLGVRANLRGFCLFALLGFAQVVGFIGGTSVCEAAQRSAQPIVIALEDYHTDPGVYPTSIRELIPRFFSDLPESGIWLGGPFRYQNNDSDHYVLGFRATRNRLCVYDPQGGSWRFQRW